MELVGTVKRLLDERLVPKPVADSDESRPGVILDFDANGKVIGFEVLDASRHMPVPPTVALEIVTRVAG
jgi:uncharacterized protein YuzE